MQSKAKARRQSSGSKPINLAIESIESRNRIDRIYHQPYTTQHKFSSVQFSSFFKPMMGKPMTTSLLHLRVIQKKPRESQSPTFTRLVPHRSLYSALLVLSLTRRLRMGSRARNGSALGLACVVFVTRCEA
jgi:hypothetical protein